MQRRIIDKRYCIIKRLGSGAMGEVYKVRDLKDNKIIALKILSKQNTSSEIIQRFKREFSLLAELRHPNLCEVYDFGTLKGGRSYFTMEYIDGQNIFNATKDLPHVKIYPWVVQLCRVLEYIHAKGLIHYDIKPGNVLVGLSGGEPVVKLMDFGLVEEKTIGSGQLIKGTFPYIAPEVIKGLRVDHRADLYSLGVLLYEIFTRRQFPVAGKASFTAWLKQSAELSSQLSPKMMFVFPEVLRQLIIKLLAFEPAQRFSRANEVIKEINRISDCRFELETEKTLEGYLLSSRFVDREKEMEILKMYYENAKRGVGKVILITGEAGIGKSRLLKEFKVFVQLQRGHCFMGYAHEDKTKPLEVFYDVFRALFKYFDKRFGLKFSLAVLFKIFPDLAKGHLQRRLPELIPVDSQAERLRTFEALSELIRYMAEVLGNVVIFLEDLHWADDLTVRFLEYLGRNIKDRPVLICASARHEELKKNPPFMKIVNNLRSEDCLVPVALKPLSYKSLYLFLDSTITPDSNSAELTRYLMDKTGGNPYFGEELMRTLLRHKGISIGEKVEVRKFTQISIPATIEAVVLKRLEGLDHDTWRVLKLAAILLNDFNYDLIKHLVDLDDAELTKILWDLKSKRILIEEDNLYKFYHTTLRETIFKRLGDKERRDFSYEIAKTLEKINRRRRNTVIEHLAYYFINANDRKKGMKYGLEAAKKSGERYANEQAIRFYRGVLKLLKNKDRRRRFDVLQKLSEIEILAGFYDDAIKHSYEALHLKIGSIPSRVKINLNINNIYEIRGEHAKALHIYQRLIIFLQNFKNFRLKTALKVYISVKMCKAYLMIGDYKSAGKFNFEHSQFFKGLEKKEALRWKVSVYTNLGTIEYLKARHVNGDYHKAVSYYEKAYQCTKGMVHETGMRCSILNNLGLINEAKFNFPKAFYFYKKAIQISEKMGNHYGESIGLCNLANVLKIKCNYEKALDYLQNAFLISRKIGNPETTTLALSAMGECFLALCDYKKSIEYFNKTLKIYNKKDWTERTFFPIHNIGSAYRSIADYTSALRFCRKALKISRKIEDRRKIARALIEMSSVFIDLGKIFRAKRYIEKVSKILDNSSLDIIFSYHLILCRINIMNKNFNRAHDYYEKAVKLAKAMGMKRDFLRLLILGSEIHYQENKYFEAINIARRVVNLSQKIGARDLYIEALLIKIKSEMKQNIFSVTELVANLQEAIRIARNINAPELLWQTYFVYGSFLENNKEYRNALRGYKECIKTLLNTSIQIKNEDYKKSYLGRPDRCAVLNAVDRMERLVR